MNTESNKERKVIDWNQSVEIVGGNSELARNLLEMLVDDLPQQEVKMSEALRQEDLQTLSHIVHSLHGATCYCGVPELRHAVKDLEIATVKRDQNVQEKYNEFKRAATNLTKALDEEAKSGDHFH